MDIEMNTDILINWFCDDKAQISEIEKDWRIIDKINHPSEKVQLAAIEENPSAITCIENPTKKVINLALSKVCGTPILKIITDNDIDINNNQYIIYKPSPSCDFFKEHTKYINICNNNNIDYSIYYKDRFNIFICFNNKTDYLQFKLAL